jgi:hypothetical protein
VLEEDLRQDEVLFVHQLLQEYFAARRLAQAPQPALVQQPWRAHEVAEDVQTTLRKLADSDPLPPLPSTGWEETTVLAAAMASQPEGFITALMEINLPLAGRCAVQPDVQVSKTLKNTLRWALVQRTQDPAADLRARIAAGLALGPLGDPRFARRQGPHGVAMRSMVAKNFLPCPLVLRVFQENARHDPRDTPVRELSSPPDWRFRICPRRDVLPTRVPSLASPAVP